MGKSNSFVFEAYASMVDGLNPSKTAFLGFTGENEFTRLIPGEHEFFDLALGNWEINSGWTLPGHYDLIICTRCPYFSRDPLDFLSRCKLHLNPGGRIFIDWGLGDHWRFPTFKVGWVRDGEHESAYVEGNFLHSCMWRPEFVMHPEVERFRKLVSGRFGYPVDLDLTMVINEEVPVVVDYDYDRIGFLCLWDDFPQLYIMTLI